MVYIFVSGFFFAVIHPTCTNTTKNCCVPSVPSLFNIDFFHAGVVVVVICSMK